MASVLEAAARAVDPNAFSPTQTLSSLSTFSGWTGNKAVIDWRGLAFWHAGTCENNLCSFEAGLHNNIWACPTMRALIHLSTHGLEPAMWYVSALTAERGTPHKQKPAGHIPMSAPKETFARSQHERFERAGVLTRISNRLSALWRKQGQYPSLGFVVRKWKALQSSEASIALNRWLDTSPEQVSAFAAGDQTAMPPPAAYKAKDRVVYDFKEINTKTARLPMTFSTIKEVFYRLASEDWLLVLDIEDGFTGIPVAENSSSLFWVRTQGQPDITLQRMPFGYALAPFVFCVVSAALGEAVASAVRGSHPEVFVYMDDVLIRFKAGSAEEAMQVRNEAIKVFKDFGFKVNPAKVDGPGRRVTYLGYELAVSPNQESILSMPHDKILTYKQLMSMLSRLIRNQQAAGLAPALPKKALESLIGKLEHVSSLLPLAKHRLARLYSVTRSKTWRYTTNLGPVQLNESQLLALDWFANQLNTALSITRTFKPSAEPSPWSFFGASDASGEGGLGGYLVATGSPLTHRQARASHWSIRIPGTSSNTELIGQSTYLELKGIIVAVEAARDRVGPLSLHPTFRLALAVDSQPAHYLCRKGYSTSNAELNTLAGRLKELQLGTGCDLTTIWVPREFNTLADALSHPDSDHSLLPLSHPPCSIDELKTRSDFKLAEPTQASLPPRPGRKTPFSLTHGLLLMSLLLFAVAQACAQELAQLPNVQDIRLEAKNRVDALATSTSIGYMRAAARLISSMPVSSPISYSSFSTFIESKVTSGTWASHNVSSYTNDIAAALAWLALPQPTNFVGKRKDWLVRAMQKARGSRGPRKRKYFSIGRLGRITSFIKSKAKASSTRGSIPAAALWLGFLGTMRTNEIRSLKVKHIRPLPRHGTPTRFRIRISDKTHPHNNRRIIVPILDAWHTDAERVLRRIDTYSRDDQLIKEREWAIMANALRLHRRRPGNLRPAGNTFWIESEAQGSVISANGGWTEKSSVPGRHYTTVTGSIAAKLKALAEARIAKSGVGNAGGTPRPRRRPGPTHFRGGKAGHHET